MYKKKKFFHANGKLLITGEYFVLEGALALALPVNRGQSLTVFQKDNGNILTWESYDEKGAIWFTGEYDITKLKYLKGTDSSTGKLLEKILKTAKKYNSGFLRNEKSLLIKTHLEFPRNWGFGSSSTLIFNIAKWAEINPFRLQFETMGGSGYDIACAGSDSPILYQLESKNPIITPCSFSPEFKDKLFFVFLNKKQDTRKSIDFFKENEEKNTSKIISEISEITKKIVNTKSFSTFTNLIFEHEQIVSNALNLHMAKDSLFPDFGGQVKSLGAWGGDFVLITSDFSEDKTKEYFYKKGFNVVLKFSDLMTNLS